MARMLEILSFLTDCYRYPTQRDYALMGMGIRARSRLPGDPWKHHLRLSSSFIRENAPSGGKIALLGAGRLLDVDTMWLANSFSDVCLLDYDPGCRRDWDRLARGRARFGYQIREVTGVMESWSEALRNSCNKKRPGISNIREALEQVSALKNTGSTLPEGDTVVSLNLLSQIPLYWRDRVIAMAARIKISEDRVWAELGPELQRTMDLLQHIHLSQLFSGDSDRILIVTDTEFYYYLPEESEWQVESALSSQAADSLKDREGFLRGAEDCWLWHLAPANSGGQEYGEIHRVEAVTFTRGR